MLPVSDLPSPIHRSSENDPLEYGKSEDERDDVLLPIPDPEMLHASPLPSGSRRWTSPLITPRSAPVSSSPKLSVSEPTTQSRGSYSPDPRLPKTGQPIRNRRIVQLGESPIPRRVIKDYGLSKKIYKQASPPLDPKATEARILLSQKIYEVVRQAFDILKHHVGHISNRIILLNKDFRIKAIADLCRRELSGDFINRVLEWKKEAEKWQDYRMSPKQFERYRASKGLLSFDELNKKIRESLQETNLNEYMSSFYLSLVITRKYEPKQEMDPPEVRHREIAVINQKIVALNQLSELIEPLLETLSE